MKRRKKKTPRLKKQLKARSQLPKSGEAQQTSKEVLRYRSDLWSQCYELRFREQVKSREIHFERWMSRETCRASIEATLEARYGPLFFSGEGADFAATKEGIPFVEVVLL